MRSTLSEKSSGFAIKAHEARSNYLEFQAALWVIYAEQGEQIAAQGIDVQAMKLFTSKVWTCKRELMALILELIRDKNDEMVRDIPSSVLKQLQRYARNDSRWWSATQILLSHCADQYTTYTTFVEMLLAEESPKSSPTMIAENLEVFDIQMPVKDIERYLISKGLINEKPQSHYADAGDKRSKKKLCGPCGWLKTVFKKPSTAASPAARTDRDLRQVPIGSGV